MANMKPTGHVNQFANPYSFEAKTAKLPHYTQLENLAILQNRNPEQQAAQQIYSNWRPAVQNIASSRSASTGTPTNIVTNPPAPTDGGGGGDIYAGLKADISSAWDAYTGSLESIGNEFLPQQRTAQENIAQSQLVVQLHLDNHFCLYRDQVHFSMLDSNSVLLFSEPRDLVNW